MSTGKILKRYTGSVGEKQQRATVKTFLCGKEIFKETLIMFHETIAAMSRYFFADQQDMPDFLNLIHTWQAISKSNNRYSDKKHLMRSRRTMIMFISHPSLYHKQKSGPISVTCASGSQGPTHSPKHCSPTRCLLKNFFRIPKIICRTEGRKHIHQKKASHKIFK